MLAVGDVETVGRLPFHDNVSVGLRDLEDFLNTPHMIRVEARQKEEDLEVMFEVTKRIREQLRYIIHAVRCWRSRHEMLEHSVQLRYSAYEGALCYSDLRRHWAYYRHAMAELTVMAA